ncbi:MAG: class I SAM-dependent methyltransferase [Chitinophagaceae bacterium]|nr:MAG: class I SAM-dependent methyltransferase [Chitinophagaceae bacterium]
MPGLDSACIFQPVSSNGWVEGSGWNREKKKVHCFVLLYLSTALPVVTLFNKIKNKFLIRFTLGKDPAKRIIAFWKKNGPDFRYFESAEDPRWIDIFWKEESLFRRLFSRLDLTRTLEIACGAGRHSWQVRGQTGELYLLDSSAGALELARQKFAGTDHVHFIHHPSGNGLPDSITDNSFSSIFSYDAMVHFEKETVRSYLLASFRALRPGGLCLFHYSNYHANPAGPFSANPGWRNYLTQELFTQYFTEAGFTLIETHLTDFSAPQSDAVSLLLKP